MSESAEKLLPTLYALSEEDRAYIARCLLESLDETEESDPESDEAEIRTAWIEELNRRVAEIKAGKIVGVPAEDVHRMVRESRQ